MKATNVNHIFIGAMTVAACAAAASVMLHLPVPVVLVCELLPLCMYFVALYRIGTNGLSHTAIDSVYYFGFIVTILSLAGSVLRVWMFGIEKDMSGLIAQFGVGLLATGLALVFRLILTARVESLNAKDLSQTIDEYVQRIDGIVVKVETSAASFEGLSQSLQERTRAVVEATYEECTARMRSAAAVFAESITGITQQTSESVTRFGEVVQSVAVASHVQHFDANINELTAGLKGFAAEVSKYGRLTTDEALRATKQALDASGKWHAESLGEMSKASQQAIQTALAALSDLDMSVDTSTVKADLQALSRAIATFTKKFAELDDKLASAHARQSADVLEPIVEKFAENLVRATGEVEVQALAQFNEASARLTSEAVKGIADIGERTQVATTHQVDVLATHVDRLSAALEHADHRPSIERNGQRIDALAESVDRLVASVDRSERLSAVDRNGQRIDELAGTVDRLVVAIGRTDHLSVLERTGQRVEALTTNVERVVATLERSGQQSGNERTGQQTDALASNIDRLIAVFERSSFGTNRPAMQPPDSIVQRQAPVLQMTAMPNASALASHANPS
ncbi:hypothetical protein [Caballeronia sp. GAFFF1]|uniref:hypothetical protein n=1 Tax=Caballeronia sp. GAFFF1 TaxID=2921779 RepID=UPI00202943D5|nr:hypothetical protein [Caballeronia sp. GAFFF1]